LHSRRFGGILRCDDNRRDHYWLDHYLLLTPVGGAVFFT